MKEFRDELERRHAEDRRRLEATLRAIDYTSAMSLARGPREGNDYDVSKVYGAYQLALRAQVNAANAAIEDPSVTEADPDRLRAATAKSLVGLWLAVARIALDDEQLRTVDIVEIHLNHIRHFLLEMGEETMPFIERWTLAEAWERATEIPGKEARAAKAVQWLTRFPQTVQGGAKTAKRRLKDVMAVVGEVREAVRVARQSAVADVGSRAPARSGTLPSTRKPRTK